MVTQRKQLWCEPQTVNRELTTSSLNSLNAPNSLSPHTVPWSRASALSLTGIESENDIVCPGLGATVSVAKVDRTRFSSSVSHSLDEAALEGQSLGLKQNVLSNSFFSVMGRTL